VKSWKGTVIAYFKVLSWHLPAETEEDHGNPQRGWQVTLLGSELSTSWSTILCYPAWIMYCSTKKLVKSLPDVTRRQEETTNDFEYQGKHRGQDIQPPCTAIMRVAIRLAALFCKF
jgi:hypothetical protein